MKHIKRLICIMLSLSFLFCAALPAAAAETGQQKYAAITFDDGPHPEYTPWLLDELRARNVKCTFFVLGKSAKTHPEIVRQAYDDGHQIASHTYSHAQLPKLTVSELEYELEAARAVLEGITGEKEFMLRIPYGYYSDYVLRYINTPVVLWSVDGTNGKTPYTTDSLTYHTKLQMHDGAIILLHDTSKSNINAALRVIDDMRDNGYTFVTVEELFRIKRIEAQNGCVYHKLKDSQDWFDESRLRSHWAYNSIRYAKDHNIMQGDGWGFKPNEGMTRAMAVTTLWRANGEPKAASTSKFTDVAADSWYAAAVSWAAENGIITGISSSSFAPDEPMSREQFFTIVSRHAKLVKARLKNTAPIPSYTDSNLISNWAYAGVSKLLEAGFVSANSTSAFRPMDVITRAEAAELLSWYHKLVNAPSD